VSSRRLRVSARLSVTGLFHQGINFGFHFLKMIPQKNYPILADINSRIWSISKASEFFWLQL
jgi:hypothetical protein